MTAEELRRKLDDTEQHIFRVKQLLRRLETKREELLRQLGESPQADSKALVERA